MRNRVNYQVQNIYTGPAPATGFHFLSYTGKFNNDFGNLETNNNLLFPIDRVQSATYSVDFPRSNVSQFGDRMTVDRPILTHPDVTLEFDYYLVGVRNELRLGFNANYAQFQYPYNGDPYYYDNFGVDVISGFFNKNITVQEEAAPFYPFEYRDCRNIFLAVGPQGKDIRKFRYPEDLTAPSTGYDDPDIPSYNVIGFGNCYLNSYKSEASVSSVPKAKVAFLCDNIKYS